MLLKLVQILKSLRYIKRIFAMSLLLSAILLVFLWSKDAESSVMMVKVIELEVHNKLCHVNKSDGRSLNDDESLTTMIYYVTPTYPRPEQIPELTRLSHTLMHVPRIHWIVADDQPMCSEKVLHVLQKTGLPFTYISSPKPYKYINKNFPRGVANRRAALAWLQENVKDGILYFGDDDNTVDLELFDEIRQTKKVSMFPVGLVGLFGVSSPVVVDGKVVAFFDSWPGHRTYPVDMAGFAVNLKFLKPDAIMPYTVGQEESEFLTSLGLNISDIEPLAANCTKVLVWHTKTAKNKLNTIKIDTSNLSNVIMYKNFVNLIEEVRDMKMVELDTDKGIKPFIVKRRDEIINFG